MNREMLGEIEKLKSDVRWLEGALNSHAIERDRLVKEVYDLRAEIEWLRAEMEERNRIIGMSREREARHLAEIQLLKAERNEIIEQCAEVAEHYEPRCDVCPSGVAAAIRALKEER